MTVAELIAELRLYDPTDTAVISDSLGQWATDLRVREDEVEIDNKLHSAVIIESTEE